jgi:protein tyrosine/serine phosphatase
MTVATFDRIVACDGIVNFRDYGGYAVRGGGRVRTGMLYRSAQHKDATPADLARVAAIGFDFIFDLRGEPERLHAPCPRPKGFRAAVIVSEGSTTGSLAPHLAAAEGGVTTVDQARRALIAVYRGMVQRPGLQAVMRRYFETLSRGLSTSLIHCHSGKDRTGIAVALLHRILGVHEDDMITDYLLTNAAARIGEGPANQLLRERYPHLEDAAVNLLQGVHADCLAAAFDEMTVLNGSVEAYLADVMGVDEKRAERLQGIFIA